MVLKQEYQENLCNKCPSSIRGKCCFFSVNLSDNNSLWKISLSKHPCKYLNIKTGRCKNYNKKHEVNPNCLTVKEMILLGTLPKECLYVINNQNYRKRKDTVCFNIPENIPLNVKEEYDEMNNLPHLEIGIYETLRTHLCPKCNSIDLEENWDDRCSILFFRYKCNKCGYEWDNFKKQTKFTLNLLKKEV